MRTIRQTSAFKRYYKRKKKGRFSRTLDAEAKNILTDLAADRPLPERHHDHALAGSWKDHRDCHVQPDLVLIYRKPDAGHLDPVRVGSHGELGLRLNLLWIRAHTHHPELPTNEETLRARPPSWPH